MIAMFWFSRLWEIMNKPKIGISFMDEMFIVLNIILAIAIALAFAICVFCSMVSGRLAANRIRRRASLRQS